MTVNARTREKESEREPFLAFSEGVTGTSLADAGGPNERKRRIHPDTLHTYGSGGVSYP